MKDKLEKIKQELCLDKEKNSRDFDIAAFSEDDSEEENKILKRKKVEVKPMNEEEAILQMELLGHQFYMYKDSDTDLVNVVYKRTDGNYGVIESE